MTFGEFFRSKRVLIEPSLRRFCDRFKLDPGNVSRMERNLIPPPKDDKKLLEFARILEIKKSSPDFNSLFVLAEEGAEALRLESFFHNLSDKRLIHKMPLLLKRLDSDKLTEKKLDELIEFASI